MNYVERIIDKELKDKLSGTGAVLIRGPKWCGKTTSAKQVCKSILEFQDADLQDNYINLANTKPSLLLEGEKPRLIDEWQIVPKIWNAVRYYIDKESKFNQFVLTGSAVPLEESFLHSGVGRFSFVDMKTMTLYESGDSNGKISLNEIYNGNYNIDGIKSSLTYEDIAYIICRGGWPNSINHDENIALNISYSYIDALINSDISRIDGVSRNPILAKTILKSYSRQLSSISSNQVLFDDVRAFYGDVSDKTILDYLNVLKKLYIIDEISAWNPNVRSKTAVRTANKKSLIDPSLATAVLNIKPKDLIFDLNTYGLFFENLVNRDLSIYIKSIGGYLNHYRDRYGLEIDNVLHFADGSYALVETKLSFNHINEAVDHLIKLRNLIIETNSRMGEPKFLMVITATDIAYTTPEGVLIVPIGCLKN